MPQRPPARQSGSLVGLKSPQVASNSALPLRPRQASRVRQLTGNNLSRSADWQGWAELATCQTY